MGRCAGFVDGVEGEGRDSGYALLLGSGASIASGVKTGWGGVQDLIGKVAAAQRASVPAPPADPDVAPEPPTGGSLARQARDALSSCCVRCAARNG